MVNMEIRKIREKLKMPRRELSEKSGVSVNVIAYFEYGERDISCGKLIALMKALNLSLINGKITTVIEE